jgi:hypothetical protein
LNIWGTRGAASSVIAGKGFEGFKEFEGFKGFKEFERLGSRPE